MNEMRDPRATPMPTSLSAATLRERAKARGEPDWLVDARLEALARYQSLEAPQWRRTELAGFDVEAHAWKAFLAPPALVRPFAKAPGLVHVPLAQAAREHPDLVRGLLAPHARADKWEALQAALWTDGSLLFAEKGKELEAPLESPTPFPRTGGIVRDLVLLERASKANVLARANGASAGTLVQHGLEIELREGANLTLSTLQDLDHGAILLAWRRARLARDSGLVWIDGQFGAGTSVVVNENLLDGPGCQVHYIGAFFGSAKQHMDITTAALHGAPHTQSRLDMKGALSDDGYSANYSIVFIGPQAKNASGHQHQETLVLSEHARADAIPKLDVENNDVSASHGATVGQVDPEQLFYLRSRGFSDLAARRLIVEGFFDPLLSKVPIEGVRDEVRAALVGRLKG